MSRRNRPAHQEPPQIRKKAYRPKGTGGKGIASIEIRYNFLNPNRDAGPGGDWPETEASCLPKTVLAEPRIIVAHAAVLSHISRRWCLGSKMRADKSPKMVVACSFSNIPVCSLNQRGVCVETTVLKPSDIKTAPKCPAPQASVYATAGFVF